MPLSNEKGKRQNEKWRRAGRNGAQVFILTFSFLISGPFSLSAAIVSRHWGTLEGRPEGLPQNSVIAMTQTRDGYLWLGTLNGLVRFDGIQFTVFDESNTPGLNSSRIVYLFEDSQTNLWIGTETAGISLVKNGKVTSLDIGVGGREGRLVSACEDSTGAVWLYTASGQLIRYRDGRGDIWNIGRTAASGTVVLIAEKSGPLWVGMNGGLYAIGVNVATNSRALAVEHELKIGRFDFLVSSQRGGYWRLADGKVQKWKGNQLERDLGAAPWHSPVAAACEDPAGNLIVGTFGEGVFWFDADGKSSQIASGSGLSHNTVLSLCMDRQGDLWVGTDGGGLNLLKRQLFEVVEETRHLTTQSVSEDNQGGLFVGAYGLQYLKDGTVRHLGATNFISYLKDGVVQPVSWTNLYVRSVFVDRDQRVWVGTDVAGLFQFRDGDFHRVPGAEILGPSIWAIHQTRDGAVWVGMLSGLARWQNGEWKLFRTVSGLPSDAVRAIAEDNEGNLWIGTERGLSRFRDGKFTSIHKADGLPSEDVSSLLVDKEGVLWVGTFGGGLGRFEKGRWTRYTTSQGLVNNSIGYLIEDDHGYFWMGSYIGLMRVEKKDLNDFAQGLAASVQCRAYGKSDGLPDEYECTSGSQPAACRTRDGKLWFPTIKGLVSLNPARLTRNTNPPPVLIESVLVEGEKQNTNAFLVGRLKSVTLPPGKERLDIHYTSLNLGAADKARFKYRLGHESGWTEVGNTRVAHYSKLPPGEYAFEVTAANEDGFWNPQVATLALIIEPPFWRTWWFIALSVAVLLGIVVASVHYVSTQKLQRELAVLRQQEALEKERARIARDLHDQLGANLTQVALLGELAESDKDAPEEVEAHARQISKTARETTRSLDEIVWAANPANDTLDSLVTYICKYAQEYLEIAGLRYRLEVPAQLPGTAIAPDVRHNVFLAAKEAITNVVRHAQASTAWLRLKLEPRSFTLEIQDDGRGPSGLEEARAQSRNGLRNMRKRMEDIGGEFSIGPVAENGTLVRLRAPLGNESLKSNV
jgi:ligand-binding sensor domain-containing protein/signal transduction histidine kinase